MRIGYLIPEFPAQTHAFFWREREALRELGIDTCLISTTRPPQSIISHTWSEQALRETIYLVPLSMQDGVKILTILLKAGGAVWKRCLQTIWQAPNLSLKQRLHLVALVPIAAKLVALSRAQGWTHIHVHSCAASADLALFASLLSPLSYSLTQHGPAHDTYGPNQAQKWRGAKFGIFVSEVLRQEVRDRIGQALPARIPVATMGVNLAQFSRCLPYTPWTGMQPCHLFTIGRLNVVKAYDDLIEAVAQLVQRGFDIQLQIAGEDEQGGKGYRLHIEHLIQSKGLGNRIRLLGAISEPAIQHHLEAAHLFVLASLNEGTSVALMEAMAMELPVVTTAVGGTPQLIHNGVSGILVEPRDPGGLADAIAQVLTNAHLATTLGQAARRTIEQKYHHRCSAETLAGLLQAEQPNYAVRS